MINGKKIIALCAYRVYDSQVFSFISKLNKLLCAQDCYLFIYALNAEIGNSGENMAEVAVFDIIPYDKIDAIIIMDEKIKSRKTVESIILKTRAFNIPTIVVDGEYEGVSLVRFDYAKGFEQVVRHVIEHHKVRKPHLMAGKRSSEYSNERIEVFKKVIAENGIAYDDSMLSYGNFWSIPSRAAAKELLKRDQLPEAVICANDIMAINVCDVFRKAGVNVPEDVIITGFDGMDEAFWASPGITTAKCDSKELAKEIFDVLKQLLSGAENVDRWIMPTLMTNDSCGCPRRNLDLLTAIDGLNNRFYHHQDDIHIMLFLISKIMSAESIEEGVSNLRNALTEHLLCVVDDACFDLENNYLLEENVPHGSMSIIYDSYSDVDGVVPYNPDTIHPHLDEIMKKGYPLIFNCLEYMDKSPGFVCYSFPRMDNLDYSKTPSITNSLGMGFGGYVSMKNQRYLRSKLQKMYQYDALTGLYNRLAFRSKVDILREDPLNEGKELTIVMGDLNGLKQINDSLGHMAGDKAIATAAKALKCACPPGSLCVRLGGDELLAFIIGDCDARAVIDGIIDILDEESRKLGYTVSLSVGARTAVFSKDMDLDSIIDQADAQMYEMKRRLKEGQGS